MSDRLSPLSPKLPAGPGSLCRWGRLYGSAKGLALARAAETAASPLLVLTADIKSAERLMEEIRFYRGEGAEFPILFFPDWETLPYDGFSPYQDIISDRLETLTRLPSLAHGIVIAAVSTVMHRLMPLAVLRAGTLRIETGQRLDREAFRDGFVRSGYRFVSQVLEHGDIAVRGSLVDIFPMGSRRPYRLDLLDDEVDSIRVFDPETQRSDRQVDRIDVLPASEVSLTGETINRFRSSWRERFPGNPATSLIYKDVSNGIAPAGLEYYLPLFYERTSMLFDYFSPGVCVVVDEDVDAAAEAFWEDANERYEQGSPRGEQPLLPPAEMFIPPAELYGRMEACPRIHTSGLAAPAGDGVANYASRAPLRLPVEARAKQPLGTLQGFIGDFDGRILLVTESSGRRETVLDLLRAGGLQPRVFSGWPEFIASGERFGLTVAPLDQGALIDEPRLAVISESQLFGERAQQRRLRKRRQSDADAIVRNLAELTLGAPVVHEAHGVGRYRGLTTLDAGGIPGEFICLEYDRGDKLYVPVSSLELISRYTGADADTAPLHRLGSGQWQKARKRAERRVIDVAAELLDVHARRAARAGHSLAVDEDAYRAFVEGFPFEETPDQLDAIEAVLKDMAAPGPMDRLVCGDAGFGKTEVALRAAFVAVNNNRQVALLVPTTLLAQQHFQNFSDRFADWPVRIEVLSRFIDKDRQAEILARLADGKVDVVIGTHRLLQNDVRFSRLGLVIIDEEHRFGVRQKEKFKAMRAEVDVLTLTATPIPRTLNLAISELRDLSIIASPPSRRLAVKTFVQEWQEKTVKEAIQREIKRGGQVYFLHNDVQSMERQAAEIQALVPEARVRHAHGQMPERQLEQVMLDFYHRRFNILVCSTIIETGIDVPTANTIIINRADKFGLAQLYQLRGRVGRSHHRAYAYLIIPSRRSITQDAVKRLEAIESLEELGIGFTLAIHDLEIRGAGEILGEEQSGQIHEIGFSLYMELLDRAIRSLKAGRQPQLDRPLDHGTEVDLHVPALIPEDYLPDVHSRLIMYKRIASTKDESELDYLQEEMIDRFGLLPQPVRNLVAVTRLKRRVGQLGVRKIDLGEKGGRILFDDSTSIDPGKVIQLIQKQPRVYKLDGSEKLRIIKELPDGASRIMFLHDLFDTISTRDAA